MKLRSLLFPTSALCCMTMAAQSIWGDFPKVQQTQLKPAKVEMPGKIGHAPINKARIKAVAKLDRANAALKNEPFSQIVESAKLKNKASGKKLRLDSLVQTNPDGSKYTKITCEYNNQGIMTKQINSIWDSSTKEWSDVGIYDYEWDGNGLCTMQSQKIYGSGQKYTYKYNNQQLASEQVFYLLETDGTWKEQWKGEYEYNDAGDMVKENVFNYENGTWDEVTRTTATYDIKHRMTGIISFVKQNGAWVGDTNEEYEWFSDDKLNYKYMYRWIPETQKWRNAQQWIQDWRDDGLLLAQRMRYWNEDRQNWSGEYDSWGTGQSLLSYDAIMEYDSKDRITLQSHREWHKNGEVKFPASEMITKWTDNTDGTYDSEMNAYLYNYGTDDKTWNQRQYQRYNKQDSLVWDYQEMGDYSGNMLPYYEDKYDYDQFHNQIYYASWQFKDGVRTPSIEERDTYDVSGKNIIEQYFRGAEGGGSIPMGIPKKVPGHDDSDDEGWQNTSHFTYKYENGVRTEKFNWRWDKTSKDWRPNFGTVIKYDYTTPASEMMLPLTWGDPYKISTQEEYTGNGSGWDISLKTYYYSDTSAGITQKTNDCVLTFVANILKATGETFRHNVYDITGKLVYKGSKMEEDLNCLADGIYIVRSIIDGKPATLKIAINK